MNLGGATCADVLALCEEVRAIVKEKTGYDPVSYTHLDVYKRQVLTDQRHAQIISHKGTQLCGVSGLLVPGAHKVCLLYTSEI